MQKDKLVEKEEILKAVELDLKDLEVVELEKKIAPVAMYPLYGIRPLYGIIPLYGIKI